MFALPATDLPLLNDYQQRFPLAPEPFADIAACHGLAPAAVLAHYQRWQADGLISRIGPVFAPHRLGTSTLAALAVPPERLEAVAALVSAHAEVNHNYEREHHWNLWFVASARDAAHLSAVLAGIASASACPLLDLRLETAYHIDLGFDLGQARRPSDSRPSGERDSGCLLDGLDRQLLAALEDGLPLVPRPYAQIAARIGISEAWLLARLEEWLESGLLKRFGVVVRHHELGYVANAMCVWSVPASQIDRLGQQLAGESEVTLCYRRRPQLPDWPYNLYCMIHGRDRESVLATHQAMVARHHLGQLPGLVLFSRRRFKQCGARYQFRQATEPCHG